MPAAPTSPGGFRARELARRLTGGGAASPLDALANVTAEATEIEDFRPLSQSLEWRLADVYWERAGLLPFVRNDVPYLVNNTGRLSESAAAVVLAALEEARPASERVTLLELGAGTGLFARYFLDAFREACRARGCDLYDRLTYVVTDRFEGTVRRWLDDGLYADHEGHVAARACDALSVGALALPSPPSVVFCNYLLDVLPATIARRTAAGLERLCVRTHVSGGAAALRLAGLESLDEARRLAASARAEDLARLLPLLSRLDFETAYQPWTPDSAADEALARAISGDERAIVNGDALACLRTLLDRVGDSGFVLVNDYGPVRDEDVPGHVGVQRFGGSVALGLSFPLLERVLRDDGLQSLAPDGDEQRRVRTRLFARRPGERTRETFRERFRLEADQRLDAPQEQARHHVTAGRRNEAIEAYRAMIALNPQDWQMLGEAAEYVGLHLRDHVAGLGIVRAALERNPWSSSWLWNILGDCLFYAEKLDDAHEAFTQAQRIDPDDPRTNLNLAYTLAARADFAAALAALARGLAHDGRGTYRARLLEKQGQVLSAISEMTSAEQERLARRAERFR